MAQQYERTPVNKSRDFDGNGKLSPVEIANGVKLEPLKDGRGYKRIDPKSASRRLASLQDSSITGYINKMDSLERENKELRKDKEENQKYRTDSMALIKDLSSRLKTLEDKQEKK